MPRLSVIIPVYNGAKTVGSAVRSTLRALPPDATVTVLNDASTDETPTILESISDRRLSVIHAPEGMGVAAGLNHLLQATDSEFVARMDADDIVLPRRFRLQQKTLISQDVDVTFTTVVESYPRYMRPTIPIELPPGAFPWHLLITNPVSHPTMFAKRSVLEHVGGYRSVPSEDYDLWLRMCAAGFRLHRSAMPGLIYRIHDSQITASTSWRNKSWRNEMIRAAYEENALKLTGRKLQRLLYTVSKPRVSAQEFMNSRGEIMAALQSGARDISAAQRWYLKRTARIRLANARKIFLKRRQEPGAVN